MSTEEGQLNLLHSNWSMSGLIYQQDPVILREFFYFYFKITIFKVV